MRLCLGLQHTCFVIKCRKVTKHKSFHKTQTCSLLVLVYFMRTDVQGFFSCWGSLHSLIYKNLDFSSFADQVQFLFCFFPLIQVWIEVLVANQSGPVRNVVDLPGLVQLSVSLCQSQLVA